MRFEGMEGKSLKECWKELNNQDETLSHHHGEIWHDSANWDKRDEATIS